MPIDREAIAAVQHEIWTHWMIYLLGVGHLNPLDNSVRLPADSLLRWYRQMETSYAQLSEMEKESDRHQADKVIAVLSEAADAEYDALRQQIKQLQRQIAEREIADAGVEARPYDSDTFEGTTP